MADKMIMDKIAEETVSSASRSVASSDDNLRLLQQIQEEMEAVKSMSSGKERTARLEILESTMQSVRQNRAKRKESTASAMAGLDAFFADLGSEFKSLHVLSSSENALITAANLAAENATKDVGKAEAGWFPIGKQKRIDAAKAAEKDAKAGIPLAEARAKELQLDRLRNADLRQSLQTFQDISGQLETALATGLVKIQGQIDLVHPQLQESLEDMKREATNLDTAKTLVVDLESKLQALNQEAGEFNPGTADYAEHQKKVSQVANELREAKIQRDVALELFNTAEKFTQIHQTNLSVQQNLKKTQTQALENLRTTTQQRVVSFANQLSAVQSGKEQEAFATLDEVGHQLDVDGLKDSASVMVATDNLALERLASAPGRLDDIMEVATTVLQHSADVSTKMRELIASAGIDMSGKDFAHYEKQAKPSEAS